MSIINQLSFSNIIVRPFFVMWSKTGKASGLLYQMIEKYSVKFNSEKYRRVMFNGATFDCVLKDHVQQKIFFFGAYEPIELNTLLGLVKPGQVIIDAGANVGAYSLPIAKHLDGQAEVHAFEPVPENYYLLSNNYKLSGSPKNLFLNNVALWNKIENLEFNLSEHHKDNAGSFTAGKVSNTVKKLTCKAITLDSYALDKNLTRIDIIKMDIEGAEKFAIEGAMEVIKKFRPIIFIEINKTACQLMGYSTNELISPFLQINYKVYRLGSSVAESGWIKDVNEIIQANVILFPEDYKLNLIEHDVKKIKKKFLNFS